MKMNLSELKAEILGLTMHTNFIYDGIEGTIDPLTEDEIWVWWGERTKRYHAIEDLLDDKFYNNKGIREIIDEMEFV